MTRNFAVRGWVARAGGVLALVGLLAASPAAALAAPVNPAPARGEAPGNGRARIEVMAVYATPRGPVDPRLQGLERQLESTGLHGFRVLSTHQDAIGLGQSATFAVEGNRRAKITLKSRTADEAVVRVELFNPAGDKTLDTTMSFRRGRTLIVGGFKYQEGKLILPVSVDF
jgi:hypothetical protein